jgi:O-antigen ligase
LTKERYIRGLLAFSGVLAAVTGSGATPNVKLLCVAALIVGALVAGLPRMATPARALLVVAYGGLVTVSLARTNFTHVHFVSHNAVLREELLIVAAGWFGISALWGRTDDWAARRRAALLAPGVFVLTNLALWIVGFHFGPSPLAHDVPGPAEMLSHFGFHMQRQGLPLTSGINGGGVMAAIAGTISLVLLRGGQSRRIHLAIVAASLVTLGLVDARGSMLFAAVTVAAVSFTPRFMRRGLPGVALLIPVLPLVLLWLLSALSGYTSGLSRNGADVTTATGRSVIWQDVYDYLKHPHFADIFGYGYYGQVTSGVSYRYAFLFQTQPIPESAGTHNLLLQTVLDTGYVGALVVVALIVVAASAASRRYIETLAPVELATLAALIVLVLVGATESLPTIYFPYVFVVAFLLLCVPLRSHLGDPLLVEADDSAGGEAGATCR